MIIKLNFASELRLTDGRVIRNTDDAAAFAHEHKRARGVDMAWRKSCTCWSGRDGREGRAAAHLVLRWLEALDLAE
jgi:hypothetical protein